MEASVNPRGLVRREGTRPVSELTFSNSHTGLAHLGISAEYVSGLLLSGISLGAVTRYRRRPHIASEQPLPC